ncbi:hypothetical protein CBR_g39946 [Chara braunii]|uniref:Uncharacterized protein n=1 Tax=Chara braunii TaxID=69332 RepID=A0A388K1K8_CHABU|nr:hypothetical protein CBR_g39946 [Chara braunii]|eukprot:GBG63942.1 hypothetical protein CBR_g39946 [Chara braunii]
MLSAPDLVLLLYIGLTLWLALVFVCVVFSRLLRFALRLASVLRHRRQRTKTMDGCMRGAGQQGRAPGRNVMPHLQDLNDSPFTPMTPGVCMGPSVDGAVGLPPRRMFQQVSEDVHLGSRHNGPAPSWRATLDGDAGIPPHLQPLPDNTPVQGQRNGAGIPPHLQPLPDDMPVQGNRNYPVQYGSSIMTGTTVPYVTGGAPSLEDVEDDSNVGQSGTRFAPSRR